MSDYKKQSSGHVFWGATHSHLFMDGTSSSRWLSGEDHVRSLILLSLLLSISSKENNWFILFCCVFCRWPCIELAFYEQPPKSFGDGKLLSQLRHSHLQVLLNCVDICINLLWIFYHTPQYSRLWLFCSSFWVLKAGSLLLGRCSRTTYNPASKIAGLQSRNFQVRRNVLP